MIGVVWTKTKNFVFAWVELGIPVVAHRQRLLRSSYREEQYSVEAAGPKSLESLAYSSKPFLTTSGASFT